MGGDRQARKDSSFPMRLDDETRERHFHEDGIYNYIDHRKIDETFLASIERLKTSPLIVPPHSTPIIELMASLCADYNEDPFEAFVEMFAMYKDLPKEQVRLMDRSLRGN